MTFEATYLGSNGWLIKFKNTNLIIDPWLKGDLIFPPGEWFFKGSLEEEIIIEKEDFKISCKDNQVLIFNLKRKSFQILNEAN